MSKADKKKEGGRKAKYEKITSFRAERKEAEGNRCGL